jgi:hypothetical protein
VLEVQQRSHKGRSSRFVVENPEQGIIQSYGVIDMEFIVLERFGAASGSSGEISTKAFGRATDWIGVSKKSAIY